MGKKFHMFVFAFNTTVSSSSLDESILELKEFTSKKIYRSGDLSDFFMDLQIFGNDFFLFVDYLFIYFSSLFLSLSFSLFSLSLSLIIYSFLSFFHLASMQKTILTKLKLNGTKEEEILGWKVTTNLVFDGIWDNLYKSYVEKVERERGREREREQERERE